MIKLTKYNTIKYVPTGFSWTILLFGFFPAMLRGDTKWTLIIFFLDIFTGGIARIIISFHYNKIYLENLLLEGWTVVEEEIKKAEEIKEVDKVL